MWLHHNNYRAATIPSGSVITSADFTLEPIEVCELECNQDRMLVWMHIGNQGSGGNPKNGVTKGQSFWSCRPAGYDACIYWQDFGTDTFDFVKCQGQGTPATPQLPPAATESQPEEDESVQEVEEELEEAHNEGSKCQELQASTEGSCAAANPSKDDQEETKSASGRAK